ncbi:hypothetical protein KIW84_045985 [Lathyrus oleraceus]|uniref:Uncharacterized protein n=1 Tax=Pisum sativum TaxID=3888 RepID=A0A9D5AXY4_PEA|nr:hypothetical protein KIW84_045985 [Pisum sativum]
MSQKGLGKNAAITEEGLFKFSTQVSIQVEVVKSFNDSEGAQWEHSLSENPNDPDTFKRRCKIAEVLVENNFDLAFQVIYEFNLPTVDIYAGVAASLAERKGGSQLTEFFRNIKGTVDDDDWDQIASRSGSVVDVPYVAHQALHANALPVLDMCKQWLA